MPRRAAHLASLFLSATAIAAVPAAPIPAPRVDASLLARLAAPALSDREQAQSRLLTVLEGVPGSLVLAEGTLSRADLSPEQRARLTQIGAELFRAEPKAGMGVQFGGRSLGGVRIGGVVDNGQFPAARLLRANDILTHADGEPLLGSEQLRWLILSRSPGDSIRLRVERTQDDGQTETIEIDAVLGSFADLNGAAALDEPTLRAAYALRLRRVLDRPADPAVGRGLSHDDWAAALDDHPAPTPIGAPPGVLAGGTPARPWIPQGRLDRLLADSALLRAAPAGLGSVDRVQRYAALLREREALVRMQRADAGTLERRDLTTVAIEVIRFRLEERAIRLTDIDAQLERMAAETDEPAEP